MSSLDYDQDSNAVEDRDRTRDEENLPFHPSGLGELHPGQTERRPVMVSAGHDWDARIHEWQ